MNTMTYKNYTGTVEYSDEDNCLYGRIEGINDIIMYEGESISDIKQAFRSSVDDYLEHCKNIAKEPNKVYSGLFVLRIAPHLHSRVASEANNLGISLNQYINSLLAQR